MPDSGASEDPNIPKAQETQGLAHDPPNDNLPKAICVPRQQPPPPWESTTLWIGSSGLRGLR